MGGRGGGDGDGGRMEMGRRGRGKRGELGEERTEIKQNGGNASAVENLAFQELRRNKQPS